MLVVWGEVVLAGAGVARGTFFPGPGVGDVGVGLGDDEDQGEGGEHGALARGLNAHGTRPTVTSPKLA